MNKLIRQITPFIMIGIAIVAFAFGIMLLAYLFLFGAMVGASLYLAHVIREKFFRPKKHVKDQRRIRRVIDSDEWKNLDDK